MSNLISREEAIRAIISESQKDGAYGYLDAYSIADLLKNLPTKEPERKTGKWSVYNRHTIPYQYICSECGAYHRAMYDFCPSCGADMREGEKDEVD